MCVGGSGIGSERERVDSVCLSLPEVGVKVGGWTKRGQGQYN